MIIQYYFIWFHLVDSCISLTYPNVYCLSTYLLSDITECSRLILYISCLSYNIKHLSKEFWLLLFENNFRNQHLDSRYLLEFLFGSGDHFEKKLHLKILIVQFITIPFFSYSFRFSWFLSAIFCSYTVYRFCTSFIINICIFCLFYYLWQDFLFFFFKFHVSIVCC